MFNPNDFLASLERLDDIPCCLSGDELNALTDFAKKGDSELEYVMCSSFCLGFERGAANV